MPPSAASNRDLNLDLPGDRVREHTNREVNQRIDAATQASIEACVQQGPKAVAQRLAELDREWDVDRALMVAFGVVGGTTFLNGVRRFAEAPPFGERPKGLLYLFTAQLGFLALHGVVGWCPPASILRRLGFRTMREIESERRALEAALPARSSAKTASSSSKATGTSRAATRSKAAAHEPANNEASDAEDADKPKSSGSKRPRARATTQRSS